MKSSRTGCLQRRGSSRVILDQDIHQVWNCENPCEFFVSRGFQIPKRRNGFKIIAIPCGDFRC